MNNYRSSLLCVCVPHPPFFWLHLQHMEVPRLRVKLELQLPATATATPDPNHICDLHHSMQQHWILNPLSEASDQIRILTDTVSSSEPAEPQEDL